MTIDRDQPYLRDSIDIGTTKVSCHGQHIFPPYTAETTPIREVLLKPNEDANIQQKAILERNGNFIYGAKDVHDYILRNPHAANRILRLWKMNMLPRFRHHKQVRHNRKVLHGQQDAGYMRDFLADYIRIIIKDLRSFYKRDCPSDDPEELARYSAYIDALPIELVLPVPVLMDDDGRADLRIAAKRAGATDVELRESPYVFQPVTCLNYLNTASSKKDSAYLYLMSEEALQTLQPLWWSSYRLLQTINHSYSNALACVMAMTGDLIVSKHKQNSGCNDSPGPKTSAKDSRSANTTSSVRSPREWKA
jgi:hypothetical protein